MVQARVLFENQRLNVVRFKGYDEPVQYIESDLILGTRDLQDRVSQALSRADSD